MHFDEILRHIGEFGPYQKRIYFLLVLPSFFNAMQAMSTIFIMLDQGHRCELPLSPNLSAVYDGSSEKAMVFNNISVGSSYAVTTNFTLIEGGECAINVYNNLTNVSDSTMCNSWRYDKSLYTSTAVSQYNLVCHRSYLQSHAKMAFFGGFLVASCVAGTLGDIFGRRPVFIFCTLMLFVSSFSLAWAPNIIVFSILRFIDGFSCLGYFNAAIVEGLELVGPSKRIWTGILIEIMFCLGELALCGAAYLIRDWKYLQIAISAPIVVSMISICFIPESPRWLLLEGKRKEAMKTIHKIARTNNRPVPENILNVEKEEKLSFSKTIIPILKSKKLIFRFVIITFGWFVTSMTYYGITYNVGRIGGNVFVNFFLSIVVEAIGYSSCIYLSEKLGRKIVHSGSLMIAGAACIATIFTTIYAKHSYNWITIVLSMVGKLCVSVTFGNIFVYTTELFPTGIRSFALGTTNIGARIGGMVSPYIADLENMVDTEFGKALPLIIFGIHAAIAGLLSLLIPETLNKKLPHDIKEATELERYEKENRHNKSERNDTTKDRQENEKFI